jgi:UDPglucose 6-dehydrogenase
MKVGIIGYGIVGKATEITIKRYCLTDVEFCLYDLKLDTELKELKDCEVIFVCLPTPSLANGKCDTSYIENALKDLSKINCTSIIVIRSTVPPRTCEKFQSKHENAIMFMPEFLTESRYEEDAIRPEFIVIGGDKEIGERILKTLFGRFSCEKKFVVDLPTAQLLKYSLNNFFAVKVIFANEMYDIAQNVGADWDSIRNIIQQHPFVGENHFDVWYGGFRGYSGKCLPKDTKAIAYGFNSELLQLVDMKNERLLEDNKCQVA